MSQTKTNQSRTMEGTSQQGTSQSETSQSETSQQGTSQQTFDSPQTHTGRCKWFNNRLGYGFITVDSSCQGADVPEDLFVHQTNIFPTTSSSDGISETDT